MANYEASDAGQRSGGVVPTRLATVFASERRSSPPLGLYSVSMSPVIFTLRRFGSDRKLSGAPFENCQGSEPLLPLVMGFSSQIDLMPAAWNTKSARAKADWLARVPATGLVTGVVSTSGGHFLGAIDQLDINGLWNIRLEPLLRCRKTPCNDDGERRTCYIQIRHVVDGQVVGGNGHRSEINIARAITQILAQNLHLISVDSSQLEALPQPPPDRHYQARRAR